MGRPGYAVEWEFHGSGREAKAGPGPFRMSPIQVSPILEKGGWFAASTEGWQPVFIRVQSMMLSHRLYHPADLWTGSHNAMPTSEGLQ